MGGVVPGKERDCGVVAWSVIFFAFLGYIWRYKVEAIFFDFNYLIHPNLCWIQSIWERMVSMRTSMMHL